MDNADDWRQMLRTARKALKLDQAGLAKRAGVSLGTIGSYESGRRDPKRQHLVQILDQLQMDRAWRNRVLVSAGFAPDGLDQRPADIASWWLSASEAARETATYEWPSYVLSERAEALAMNDAALAIWGITDLRREFPDALDRNMMAMATKPRFADRCLNWDEAVGLLAMMFKNFHRTEESIEGGTPYFAAVVARFMQGEARYAGRLVELWTAAPSDHAYKIRWNFPIVWQPPGHDAMRYRCILSTGNEVDGLNLMDWIPSDAASWRVLEAVTAQRARGEPT